MAKYISARQAVELIKNGDRIAFPNACGEPLAFTEALLEHLTQLKDVELFKSLGVGESDFTTERTKGHIELLSTFVGAEERPDYAKKRIHFIPRHFHQTPEIFGNGMLPLDIAFIQTSVPDKHGFVSLGVAVDNTVSIAGNAAIKITQLNRHMPRCHGDCFMHISEFDYAVEADTPIIELPKTTPGAVEKAIGEHCAELIPDGATLQMGIGALPDAVLANLTDKKDLGVHTEMFSDGMVDLVEAGVVTNRKKTLHKGKMVATFLMGSRRLYDFVDDNPMVYMAGVDYTNNPYIIGQNDNLVSLNSCIEIDLTGQVNSETVGVRQISGTGGQVDFVRGAHISKGGISIIATPSTTKDGTISNIVPYLEMGAAVTTLRNEVMYVATEYGVVNLGGKTIPQRAELLISIAHPKFRDSLADTWENRFNELNGW